ncbi:MAG: hypothetical protein ABIO36_07005, partial [Pyrinomonadaceae bacterium]
MKKYYLLIAIILFTSAGFGQAQRPPRPHGGPPPSDAKVPMGENRPNRPDGPPPGEWIKPHDVNQNGNLETDEFQSAANRTFAELDKDSNGTLEPNEIQRRPRPHDTRQVPDGPR